MATSATVTLAQLEVVTGTTAQWAASSRILGPGEAGWDQTLNMLKFGDGVSLWSALSAITGTSVDTTARNAATSAQNTANSNATAIAAIPPGLATRTAVKTAAYTASPGQVVPVDISAGSFALTLPPATQKWQVAVKVVAAAAVFGTTACTLTAQSGDVINTTGTTTVPLRYMNQTKLLMSDGSGVITAVSGDFDKTVNDILYVGTLYTQTTIKTGDTVTGSTVGTTETGFASTATIPAGFLLPGMVLDFEGYGAFRATTAGPTQQPRVRVGPTATALTSRALVADAGAITGLLATTSGAGYKFSGFLTVESIGTSAVIRSAASLDFVSMASGQTTSFLAGPTPGVPGSINLNSTIDNVFSLSDQFSNATANNWSQLVQMKITFSKPTAQSN